MKNGGLKHLLEFNKFNKIFPIQLHPVLNTSMKYIIIKKIRNERNKNLEIVASTNFNSITFIINFQNVGVKKKVQATFYGGKGGKLRNFSPLLHTDFFFVHLQCIWNLLFFLHWGNHCKSFFLLFVTAAFFLFSWIYFCFFWDLVLCPECLLQ